MCVRQGSTPEYSDSVGQLTVLDLLVPSAHSTQTVIHMDCISYYASENSRVAPLAEKDTGSLYSEQNSVVMTHRGSLARTLPLVSISVSLLLVLGQPWHYCYPNSWSVLRKLSPYAYKEF